MAAQGLTLPAPRRGRTEEGRVHARDLAAGSRLSEKPWALSVPTPPPPPASHPRARGASCPGPPWAQALTLQGTASHSDLTGHLSEAPHPAHAQSGRTRLLRGSLSPDCALQPSLGQVHAAVLGLNLSEQVSTSCVVPACLLSGALFCLSHCPPPCSFFSLRCPHCSTCPDVRSSYSSRT